MAMIRKAAVIGAGTMGSGIAAQFANAGVPVALLDMAQDGVADRRFLTRQAIDRQMKAGGFMHPSAAALVTPGHIDDDLALLADADWIVEAIIEDPAIKQSLFTRIEAVRKAGAIVSSNTSTLSRARLCAGMPEAFVKDFAITHFFNPPRHMRLLEVVGVAEDAAVVRAGEALLGKSVIVCRDTPGFIANRMGCYWMAMAAMEAMAHGLSAEDADAVAGAPFGVPRTGIFGLFDLVGIDLVPLVWGSLIDTLPENDGLQRYAITADATFRSMIAEGRFGKKSKGGFYRQSPEDRKRREVVDFASLTYRPEQSEPPAALTAAGNDLRRLCADDDPCGRYAWTVLKRIVGYASAVAPEIADDVTAIDTALELGYGWRRGPFALADAVGTRWLADRMQAEGEAVPRLLELAAAADGFYADGGRTVTRSDGSRAPKRRRAGTLALSDVKDNGAPVRRNESGALWDIGDGVACLELTTKLNIVDDGVFDLIEETLEAVPAGFLGLVIGNDDQRAFSAGASLAVLLERIERGDFAGLRSFVARGQRSFQALRHAPFPVVGAAFGLALGGGCELLLHCDRIVAHAELTAGLPEVNVGLIPAWGGCAQRLLRAMSDDGVKGPVACPVRVFDGVAAAKLSSSALDAHADGILRASDLIVMNRAHLLHRARDEAVRLARGYSPPGPAEIMSPGLTGLASLMNGIHGERQAGRISDADVAVRTVLSRVLTGGGADATRPVSEDTIYALELDGVMELAQTATTKSRIEHMLKTGKPLRN
ncbi:3-hydroxyacyl-CoA dehydrogenase (plasmid) [Azospirillum sp. B510]|uniref:3-hydroxyacyl-CoA dehydrogenase/enoyl-CoA hydratase family protein n=1 Tax=Azospirillum sp. (strain B510) TaxID=137722 RepID=UPI0001C4CC1A|nr:3-hydroxyacyl-CoA dehydrogenase/enoyl-CoA hydratase family protein [Azospirillum sp. B510]BAI74880.1 3-hydroxyacyl-CoA dehydrogenase [Azospirillum sp. B510]